MSAIWMRARAELRSKWRATLALTLMIGLAASVVLTAAAGARRTQSAYPRFVEWANPPDAGFNISGGFGLSGIDPNHVRKLHEVTSSAVIDSFLFTATTPAGDYLFIGQGAGGALPSVHAFDVEGRVKIIDGRIFDPNDPHEVIVGNGTAGPQHVKVGTQVIFRFLKPGKSPDILNAARDPALVPKDALSPPFRATIVGTYFAVGDFGDNAYGDVYFSPAFDREYRDRIADFQGMSVRLQHGQADVPRLQLHLQKLGLGGNVGAGSRSATTPP